jgi:excisionase family DNA binding protein
MEARKTDRLLTFKEMAERSGLSESYFYTNKSLKKLTMPIIKIGRSVRVKESEFEAWLDSQVLK